MMNIPTKNEIPKEIRELLQAPEKKCYVVIHPEDRISTTSTKTEFAEYAELTVQDNSILVSLYKENCPAGALITKALWFGKKVRLLVVDGNKAYMLQAFPYKSHITGGVFAERLAHLRKNGIVQDIAAVWEMYFDRIDELPKIPDGDYTKERTDFFEMHFDNQSIMKRAVTGCRFSIAPMSDQFIEIILGAIGKVDTSNIWGQTDEFSTVYRGKREHVLDAVKACFVHSYRKGVHMTLNATLSKGCPGATEKDAALTDAVWSENEPANEPLTRDIHFPAAAKIELYPMGTEDYLTHIENVVELAKEYGVFSRSAHYTTILKADIHKLFDFFSAAAEYCEQNTDHYVLGFTLAVNFPEDEE